ncbi:hypothetical protein D3C72_1670490 [compost metagenome]
MPGPDQSTTHEFGIQQKLPGRELRPGDHPMMMERHIPARGMPAPLLCGMAAGGLGEIVAHSLYRVRNIHIRCKGTVAQLGSRPPEPSQVSDQCLINSVAQRDLHRTKQGVQCSTNAGIPQVDAHQLHIVSGMEDAPVAVDALVADERINKDGPVLQCSWHVAESRTAGTATALTVAVPGT